MKRVTVLFILVCALLLVLPASGLAAPPTFNQAIDQLVAQGYPQQIETYLDSLGTSPLGFRLAGSSADNAAADYLLRQFKAMGLANVRLEPVPVDVWDVRGASVSVGGRTMTASQFAGVPGTPATGVSGEVVYVKNGLAQDYAGLDVTGKIVLVDTTLDNWWMNMPGAEATLHGAKAMIMTYGPGSFSWTTSYPWYVPGDSLGGNDGEYDMRWVPIVYISRNDGEWLRTKLTGGPQTATVKSDVRVTMAADGGVGYNVVAEIPGSVKNGQKVLVLSHHDAHFRAGLDDTGAVATQLTIAKAMKMSGYKPQRTIVFISTTAEEFGYTNSWYDWCIGAWYANTVTHPTWPGTVAGLINLELMARNGASLGIGTSPELAPWLKEQATKAGNTLLPNGFDVSSPISTWEDGWTYTAAGVPSVVFEAGGAGYDDIYHTNFETQALVDYAYLGQIAKFVFGVEKGFDSGLLPYSPKARADDLAQAVSPGELAGAGADKATVTRLTNAVTAFRNAANQYESRKGGILAKSWAADNLKLLAIEKSLLSNLSGLDAFDYGAYPHQQVMWDVENLNAAIAALTQQTAKPADALNALLNVSLTWNGAFFSYSVFVDDLARHAPGYYRITWGAQGHEAPHLDVMPQYREIEAGNLAQAAGELTAVRDAEIVVLNQRILAIAQLLEGVTTQLDSVK
jgi:aminopeptidase YwaD